MKKYFYLLIIFFTLGACNIPAQSLPTQTQIPISRPTNTEPPIIRPTALPTSTPLPTPTETPIPCNPFVADYCIEDGHFQFQNPIFPPGVQSVDHSYRYGTTQNGRRDPHHGVELLNDFGTPVHAAADGRVMYAGSDETVKFSKWNNYYGNVIIIRHADDFYTLYAHLSQILVKEGDKVTAGMEIGKVGQSGGAIGAHLHFEVRRGDDYVNENSTENPERWLIPQTGTGTLSISLLMDDFGNVERPITINRYADGEDRFVSTIYATSYTKGFEHNPEDLVVTYLPAGRYRISFSDMYGLEERVVLIEDGKLTETYFPKR